MEFFSVEKNIQILKEMEQYGVDLSQKESDRPVEVAQDAPLKDKTILFTGTLENMTRKEAQQLALENGEIGRAHSELQSRGHLVCRLLLEKKKKNKHINCYTNITTKT